MVFDPKLASDYLDHRRLTSLPKQFEYCRDNEIPNVEHLRLIMIKTATEFNAMINEMILAEYRKQKESEK